RVLLRIVRPDAGVLNIVDIVPEPPQTFQIMQDLPSHTCERSLTHHSEDQHTNMLAHNMLRRTVFPSTALRSVSGPMAMRSIRYGSGTGRLSGTYVSFAP